LLPLVVTKDVHSHGTEAKSNNKLQLYVGLTIQQHFC